MSVKFAGRYINPERLSTAVKGPVEIVVYSNRLYEVAPAVGETSAYVESGYKSGLFISKRSVMVTAEFVGEKRNYSS